MEHRGYQQRLSRMSYAAAMAARDNYALLIRDNTYALQKMRLTPDQRRHLRQQRTDWQCLVEALDKHMTKWTVRALHANQGELPF